MFMSLKPATSKINVISVLTISFMSSLILYVRSSMTSYLLVENYDISEHDSGSYAARLGWYTDIALIPGEFLLGMLFDAFGRKKVIVAGTVFVGIIMILQTFFHKFWPWLTLLYITMGICFMPILISPL